MEHALSVIEEVFEIQGRGCVVSPGIPIDSRFVVKVGDPIRLERPDRSSIDTYVRGIEMISITPLKPHPIPILLPPGLKKFDIPIGTRVVLLNAKLSILHQD